MIAGWDDEAFKARVKARCDELGLSDRAVLNKVGRTHDYLQTTAKNGRQFALVTRLAKELRVSTAWLLGLPEGGMVDKQVLATAIRVALALFPEAEADELARVAAETYLVLLSERGEG